MFRQMDAGYECGKKKYKVNDPISMDYLKVFGKNQDQLDSLIPTVFVFSRNIGL